VKFTVSIKAEDGAEVSCNYDNEADMKTAVRAFSDSLSLLDWEHFHDLSKAMARIQQGELRST
jgi:hypothetical protein